MKRGDISKIKSKRPKIIKKGPKLGATNQTVLKKQETQFLIISEVMHM